MPWPPSRDLVVEAVTVTASGTMEIATDAVDFDSTTGTIAYVLPDPATMGNKKVALSLIASANPANAVTITPAAGLIDGAANLVLSVVGQSVEVCARSDVAIPNYRIQG